MIVDGKLSTQMAQSFHSRIPNIFFCENCRDFRKMKNGKCKKCGKRHELKG